MIAAQALPGCHVGLGVFALASGGSFHFLSPLWLDLLDQLFQSLELAIHRLEVDGDEIILRWVAAQLQIVDNRFIAVVKDVANRPDVETISVEGGDEIPSKVPTSDGRGGNDPSGSPDRLIAPRLDDRAALYKSAPLSLAIPERGENLLCFRA
jgi:hypothetical protein